MAALLATVLGGIAAQGHASVAELSWLQVGVQLVHIIAVAVWIVGLAMVALVHVRLPKVAERSGGALSARILARFSKVALVAVPSPSLTGVIRSFAELSDPAQLWETSYGQSILWKIALLIPIGALALYNRRIVVALSTRLPPQRPHARPGPPDGRRRARPLAGDRARRIGARGTGARHRLRTLPAREASALRPNRGAAGHPAPAAIG